MISFKLMILVCALVTPSDDCTASTAVDVVRGDTRYETPIGCFMDAQGRLPVVDDPTKYRIKVLCPRELRVDTGGK